MNRPPYPGVILNPECREGKHANCDGVALDRDSDLFMHCECDCHDWAEP